MKGKFWILAFSVFIFGLTAQTASAAECDFKKEVLDLQILKTAEPTELVEERELALRRAALISIIDCLISSTESVHKSLESLPYLPYANNLNIRFRQELKGNIFYYGERKKEVETASISRTKVLAREILTWKKNHTADIERASQFIIWGHNQELLSRAVKRMAQISGITLKPSSSLGRSLESARNHLSDAQSKNSLAQESFERSVSPSESLDYIKGSLEAMNNAYKNFLRIGER